MASPPTCLPCSPEFRITNDTLSRRRQLLPPFFSSNQKKKKKKKEKPSLVLQHRFTRGPNSGSSRPVPVANGPRGPTVGASHTKREAKGCRPLEQQRREERRGKERKRKEKKGKEKKREENKPPAQSPGRSRGRAGTGQSAARLTKQWWGPKASSFRLAFGFGGTSGLAKGLWPPILQIQDSWGKISRSKDLLRADGRTTSTHLIIRVIKDKIL